MFEAVLFDILLVLNGAQCESKATGHVAADIIVLIIGLALVTGIIVAILFGRPRHTEGKKVDS